MSFPELVGPAGIELDLAAWWDIATLGVERDYRGAATSGLVAMALYQALNMLADREGIEWAVAILDLVVLDLINTAWMNPFAPIPGPSPVRYLDSPASQPVFCDAAAYKAKLAAVRPGHPRDPLPGQGPRDDGVGARVGRRRRDGRRRADHRRGQLTPACQVAPPTRSEELRRCRGRR